MTNLLTQGATLINTVRDASLSRTVTYTRAAGGDPVELQAAIGSTEFEQTDELARITITRTRDYLVTADQLAQGATPFEPAVDDVIVDDGVSYRVVTPSGRQPYAYSDADQTILRVHTLKGPKA